MHTTLDLICILRYMVAESILKVILIVKQIKIPRNMKFNYIQENESISAINVNSSENYYV